MTHCENQSAVMVVFLATAIIMFAKNVSQPLSVKSFNCLLLAMLLSTKCHPPSSCTKGTRINKTSALQRVGGEVRKYMRVYVCVMCVSTCVCIYMCVTSGLQRNCTFCLKVRHRDAQ